MRQTTFTFLLILLLSLVGIRAAAHDYEVVNADGKTIFYNNLGNNQLSVTYKGNSTNTHAYMGQIVIPDIVTINSIPYSVVAIGTNAFNDCHDLTNITIPNSVKRLL